MIKKSSFKIFSLIMGVSQISISWYFYFFLLKKVLAIVPPTMLLPNLREKIFAISFIFTILVVLFNIWIFAIENSLDRKEGELKVNLDLNLDNQEIKTELEKINLQKEKYFNLVKLWYLITTAVFVFCFVYFSIVQIYRTVTIHQVNLYTYKSLSIF